MVAVVLGLGRAPEARVLSHLSPPRSLSVSSGTEPNLQGLHAAFTSHGGKAGTPPIPGLCFHKKSMFLYSILKSAANAVLKFMSAVIAIARVLFVSIKSLSDSFMLLEHSFGNLKYDSTTLPITVPWGLHLFLPPGRMFLLQCLFYY